MSKLICDIDPNRWSLFPIVEYGGPDAGPIKHPEIIADVGLWNLIWFWDWNVTKSLTEWDEMHMVGSLLDAIMIDAKVILPSGQTLIESARTDVLRAHIAKVIPVRKRIEIAKNFYASNQMMQANITEKLAEYDRKSENAVHLNFKNKT